MTPCELLDDRKLVHVPNYLNVLSFHCFKRPFIEKFFKLGYLIFALWVGLKFSENGFQSISGFKYITSSLYDSQLGS